MKHDYLLLGEVVRPQGIHGEVKLRHYTDDPERFLELKTVYREREGRYEPIGVTGARVREDDVFLMLEGVRDRNAAEALRGVKLWVDRAHARELGEDEVYIADILGAEAYDTQGGRVGTLREVLTPGGVDVFVFDTPTGTLMAPALKTVLLELDAEGGRIVLDEKRLEEVGCMKIAVLSLFPEMFDSFLSASILGRARTEGLLDVRPVDIRPYSDKKHKNTDDYPFGGGAGMVMMAQPSWTRCATFARRATPVPASI